MNRVSGFSYPNYQTINREEQITIFIAIEKVKPSLWAKLTNEIQN